jgi:hypothetical protein
MAAKPFHAGHDALIKQSLADGCDATIVFLSTGGREEISSRDMIPLWRKVYLPGITKTYGEAVTIMFSDSPMLDAMKFAKNFVKEAGKDVAVYGGVDAEGTNEAQQRVDGIIGRFPELEGKIEAVGVDRSLTGGISGTQMRQYLSNGDRRSFVSNLPSWLSPEDRNAAWSSLSKGGNLTAESLIKKIVKEVLNDQGTPGFYGVTPKESSIEGVGTYPGNQQSYGMWFTPPDLNTSVLCFFVNGDPSQGYYVGCVPEIGLNHMIPAIGAVGDGEYRTQNKAQEAYHNMHQISSKILHLSLTVSILM